MTSLLARSLGLVYPKDFRRSQADWRIRDFQAANWIAFDGSAAKSPAAKDVEQAISSQEQRLAHVAGVNCLTVDKSESRFLLSGGADGTIKLWNLDQRDGPCDNTVYRPVGTVAKSSSGHRFGISRLSFHHVNTGSFMSSSYDKTFRVWDTETLQSTNSFSFPGQVYAHDTSPFASSSRVAAALQDSFVRIIDFRIGDSSHTLPGHEGAVLSVAWSPLVDNILVSAGSDGTVRLWDIRTSRHVLGSLDYEDAVGVLEARASTRDNASERRRYDCRAHIGPCNGVIFSADGSHIITCGHDERIRVWDASTGANTLVHFGPTIRNRVLASITPILVPPEMTDLGHELMLFPNGSELLLLDMHEGTLLRRLRPIPGIASRAKGDKLLKQRVTDISWRPGHCEAYSAHSTGFIKTWMPRASEGGVDEEDDDKGDLAGPHTQLDRNRERKRRREELQELYRDLTKQKLTFT